MLFGRREPEFREPTERPPGSPGTDDPDAPDAYIGNNEAQNEAVELAVDAEDAALIHGPPGTGKTYTIARAIRALVDEGNRVLLSAFTNRAVDNALEALRDQGFDEVLLTSTNQFFDSPVYNSLRAGSRVEIPMGVNFYVNEGRFQGHRFGVEVLVPVRQSLDYLQFRRDWSVVFGWQKAVSF